MEKIEKKIKKVAIKIFSELFLFLILCSYISHASNVVLIVKNVNYLNSVHETPIKNLLEEMNHSITLADSLSNLNYSEYHLFVLAGRPNTEEKINIPEIPKNEIPIIAIDYYYPREWGWIAPSQNSIQTSQLQLILANKSHTISFNISEPINPHINKKYVMVTTKSATNLIPIVVTNSTFQYNISVAIADVNFTLLNGNITKSRIIFFGIPYPNEWTEESKKLFKNAVEWAINDYDKDGIRDDYDLCLNTPISEIVDKNGCSCSQKSCDDGITCTIDMCNASTGECVHIPNDSICDNGRWCDGQEYCDIKFGCVSSNPINCSTYNLPRIDTCNYNPDNNPFTWDFFAGFISTCDEVNKRCTEGVLNITHTCSKQKCNAECEVDSDCQNKCIDDILYIGVCLYNCSCSYSIKNCSEYNNWYETNETRWVDIDYKTQRKEIKKEYRTHYCSLEGCKYNVTNESWIDGNETRIRENGLVLYEGMKLFVNGNERTLIISIDNSSNLSRKFENVKDIVLKDSNNNTLVKFYFNFSTRNLNLSNIVIKKNENSSRGSLVIYGLNPSLPLNQTKTIWVDRKLNANRVCIKDAEISSISEISRNCNSSNEFLIKCDGSIYNASNGARYSCIIQNNYYIISGLMHSGVIEIETCNDGIRNQGEEGIDCGGPCAPCETTTTSTIVTTTSSSSSFKRLECYTPSSIVLDEGEIKIIEINVRNVGNIALYNVRASLSGISKDWYNITSQISKIESQANATFILTLKGVRSGNYNITFDAFDTSSLLCSKKISLKVNEKITTTIYTPEYPKNQSEIEETTTIEEENISKIIETSSTIEEIKVNNKEDRITLVTGMFTIFKDKNILLVVLIVLIIFISVAGFYTFDHLTTKKTIESAYKKYEEWKKKNGNNFHNNGLSNKKVELRKSNSKRSVR